jgi:hypothetical protein
VKLQPSECLLEGSWRYVDNVLSTDDVCRRIDWLIAHELRYIASSARWGDWEVLFEDPADGRYWEKTYPHGDLQGGGPPRLSVVASDEAKNRYNL